MRKLLKQSVVFILGAVLFTLVYGQSPLYSSNQNQYFLHGLAHAGYGSLESDWIVNTLDPVPAFSFMVAGLYRIFQADGIFYWVYAGLMGVYFFSLLGILDHFFKIKSSKTKLLVFSGLVLLLHSAALRELLGSLFGDDWTYALEGGFAGQRLLGPVFQPSVFGILLVVSIYMFLQGKAIWAAVLLPLAATIHPTYLLSAALLTAAYLLVIYFEDGSPRRAILTGAVSLVLVLPILVYALSLFSPSSPEVIRKAQEALVTFRIPHHSLIERWFNLSVVFRLGLIAAAAYRLRETRLFWVLVLPGAAVILLTGIQALTGSYALALLFPWRPSVFLVPLASCCLLAAGLDRLWPKIQSRGHLAVPAVVLLAAGLAAAGMIQFLAEVDIKRSAPEYPVMVYIRDHNRPGETYMVPLGFQDFRLFTGAPATIDFKAIPYRDSEVVEWFSRVNNISRIYRQPSGGGICEHLWRTARQFKATHIVLPKDAFSLPCKWLEEVYNDGEYAVRILHPDQR